MRPVLDAWVQMIAAARREGVPVIYTTPVSPPMSSCCRPTFRRRPACHHSLTRSRARQRPAFPDEIAPRPEDYVFLKRRPSAFYGTGVAELLHMLRRDTIIIGGGATNRGVETSVREAFNLDLASVVVRECCWSSDAAAHAYSLDKAMKMYARIRSLDQVAAMLLG
jgi:maleamate amidohydrolase